MSSMRAGRVARAWDVLGTVLDPEVPALSVCDLGIVREVIDHGGELEVVLTPTYSGCPATEVIEASVLGALQAEGLGPARATLRRAPAIACPHCGSARTERLSAFGSTACKALYRCLACREPFEHFKPI